MTTSLWCAVTSLAGLLSTWAMAGALEYAPAAPDNPLKGFAPYAGQASEFPHSLEFGYLPMRPMMSGPDSFDFSSLEKLLNDVKSRGCQTVFRIYLEYPTRPIAVPQFLLDDGVKVHQYTNSNTHSPQTVWTPDYQDPKLRKAVVSFIHEMGRRYDGDERIAYITAGMLGSWGEWHNFPRNDLSASKQVQIEVMDAYEAAFKRTPVLLRYPAGNNDGAYAPNHTRNLGYHDDSFAYATVATGTPSDGWFFMAKMQQAGPEAMTKWRTQPIGGETRPEVWDGLWKTPSSTPKGQEFDLCVRQTHATWLMDSSITKALDEPQHANAIAGQRLLGYEYHIASAELTVADGELHVALQLENRGVAPFYQNWPVELAALNANCDIAAVWKTDWKLRGQCPDDKPRTWVQDVPLADLPAGTYRLLLSVPNPMRGGKPLRFANRTQDAELPGHLTVGSFTK